MTMPERSGPQPAHRPILIVGSNGSGTTLLRLMLNSHERIAIPPETGFLRLAMAHLWVPYWQLGDQWAAHLDLTDDGLMSALAEFYGGLFASYAQARGKQRWGDKTPFHVWHLQLAARLFPECQVVGIVRHPGAVASSLRRRFRQPLRVGIGHWRRTTTQLLHEAIALGDRCVVLRYEDLVLDPETTMRSLLEWLDEPWSDAVLAHYKVQLAEGATSEVEGFTRSDTPINSARVAGWERQLRDKDRTTVVEGTKDLAAFLGYTPEAAMPLLPLSDHPGWPLVTGDDLRRRTLSHGAGIDWTRPPTPSHENRPFRPPAPRPRRFAVSLDDITIRDLLRHRLTSGLASLLPEGTRKRANEIRRSRPLIDRLLGPR
jgi:Sulfotransferase family